MGGGFDDGYSTGDASFGEDFVGDPLPLKSPVTEGITSPIMKYFEFKHLPEKLQEISLPFWNIAATMEAKLPPSPEKSAGLRKLLEAKDCMVRAAL